MRVAVCIPVLNEREVIEKLLSEVRLNLQDVPHTVCLVDDGSTDGTVEFIQAWSEDHPEFVLLQREKRGSGCQRGAATRAGLEWLLTDEAHQVFVDLDADGAQPPAELSAGIDQVLSGAADVVIASKYLPESVVRGRPMFRTLGSRAYNIMLRFLMRGGIRDYSNSYRFYNRRAAEALMQFSATYTTPVYLIEMMAIWFANGFRVRERPTCYVERESGASKVTLSDVCRGFGGAFLVGLRYGRGDYQISPPRSAD